MRNRSTPAVLLALAATLACAAVVEARPANAPTSRPARDLEAIFKRLDTDHDGLVSKAEFDAFAKQLADRREKAGKGGKSGKGNADVGAKLFEKLDADHDGSLTPEEFKKLSELRQARGGEGKRNRAKA